MDIYEQLRRDEGVCLKPYRDFVGKLTIGVGRNLDDVGITDEEATRMLDDDVCLVAVRLESHGFDGKPASPDCDPRYAVLLNMAFNMGVFGLLEFRNMLKAYRAGDYATAAQEMLNSKWATQVGDRAHRLAKQMEEGIWV